MAPAVRLRILLLWCFAGAAAQAQPVAGEAPADLQTRIEAFVNAPRFAGAAWGIKVVSLDTGRTLAAHGDTTRLSPASNAKLYAAAYLLDALGGDYRLRTAVQTTEAVRGDGALAGDLVIAGTGDPSWNPRRLKQDFGSAFAPFVAALQRAGVRRIAGDLVADGTHLRVPPHGASWTADDLNDYYGAEVSALTLDDNYVDLRATPAATVGASAVLELLAPHTGLTLDNRTVTLPAGTVATAEPKLRVLRLPGESSVRVFGELPVGAAPQVTEITVPRPGAWFAVALKAALERVGIVVEGRARDVRWPEPSAFTEAPVVLAEMESPPLRELLRTMLGVSQNLWTDLLFAHAGEQRRTAATPAARRSDALALEGLQDFLQRNDLRADEVSFDEASGLSRNNLTTAAATVRLLEFMATHREAAAFLEALPVAGRDGSLAKRMKGTAAEGNVRAKTGSLRWAHTLSGYVTTATGERLAFSLMLNRHRPAPDRAPREELDEIAVWLAELRTRE